MRERTTWDRTKIANQLRRVAEDPRAMNQDHLQQQPAADAYLLGDGSPSEFAEDVHSDAQNWKAEQGGDGNTSRNEIGMPQMRSDTFNHPEKAPGSTPARGGSTKTAEEEMALVTKKAELCTKIATKMLKNANANAIEDQAVALMDLPHSHLIATFERLAAQDDEDDSDDEESDDEDEGKQAKKAQQDKDDDKGKKPWETDDEDEGKQAKKAQQQESEDDDAEEDEGKQAKKAQQDDDAEEDEGKQAKKAKRAGQQDKAQDKASQDQDKEGQDQEEKKAKKAGQQKDQDKASQQQEKKEGQDQDEGQDKEAAAMARAAASSLISIPEGPARTAAMQAVAGPLYLFLGKKAQLNQQAQQQLMSQVQQMIQQAMQQQQQKAQQQQGQQQPVAQQGLMSDDQLLDQMLQQDDEYQLGQQLDEAGIQMDSPTMDIGDVVMSSEDDILQQVFASGSEVQDAMKAASLQGHTTPLGNPQGMTRTAATRTVGTRPSEGVSVLGGASPAGGNDDVSKLSNLWSSAPDVSDVFR